MSQAIIEAESTEVEEATEAARPTFAAYADIHGSGGIDSTPEQIRANTCGVCFTVFPATNICGVCD